MIESRTFKCDKCSRRQDVEGLGVQVPLGWALVSWRQFGDFQQPQIPTGGTTQHGCPDCAGALIVEASRKDNRLIIFWGTDES